MPASQDSVFGCVFDENLQVAKLNGVAVSDLLGRSPMKERLEAANNELLGENDGKPGLKNGIAGIRDVQDDDNECDDVDFAKTGNAPKAAAIEDPEGHPD